MWCWPFFFPSFVTHFLIMLFPIPLLCSGSAHTSDISHSKFLFFHNYFLYLPAISTKRWVSGRLQIDQITVDVNTALTALSRSKWCVFFFCFFRFCAHSANASIMLN